MRKEEKWKLNDKQEEDDEEAKPTPRPKNVHQTFSFCWVRWRRQDYIIDRAIKIQRSTALQPLLCNLNHHKHIWHIAYDLIWMLKTLIIGFIRLFIKVTWFNNYKNSIQIWHAIQFKWCSILFGFHRGCTRVLEAKVKNESTTLHVNQIPHERRKRKNETIVIHLKKWNRTISEETESDCEQQQKSSPKRAREKIMFQFLNNFALNWNAREFN